MAGGDVRHRKGNNKKNSSVIHEDVDALKKTLADAVARRESRSGVSYTDNHAVDPDWLYMVYTVRIFKTYSVRIFKIPTVLKNVKCSLLC